MTTDHSQRLRPLIRYLETHYANPPTLAEAARRVALSPWHFHRLFREHTGETYASCPAPSPIPRNTAFIGKKRLLPFSLPVLPSTIPAPASNTITIMTRKAVTPTSASAPPSPRGRW